ncbi:unnamed protein product, partial [marine sediment metagenome]
MKILQFTLEGESPLLMHNPAGSMRQQGEAKLSTKGKEIPTPEVAAAATRYLLPDGNFYIPAVAVRASMLSGAKFYRIGKAAARSILSGAVILTDETFPLFRNGNPISGDDYSIDGRRAVIQNQGIWCSRARIELPWEVFCTFEFN